jgi:hypothetical protein
MKLSLISKIIPLLLIGYGCGGNCSNSISQEPYMFDLAFSNSTGNAELTPITTDRVTGDVYGSRTVRGVGPRSHFVALAAENLGTLRPGFDKWIVLNLNGPQLEMGDAFQVRLRDDLPAEVGHGDIILVESPLDPTEIEYLEYLWIGNSGTVTVEALQGSVVRLRLANVVLQGFELAEGTVELNGVVEVDYDQIPDEDPDHDPDAD